MSHTVKIATKFTQLDCLKKAFEHFGWEIKEKSKIRTYQYDEKADTVYDFIAVNPGKEGSLTFDLGIKPNENGELQIYGDMWGGSVGKTLGTDLEKLKQEYAYNVIEQVYSQNMTGITREIVNDNIMVTVDLY